LRAKIIGTKQRRNPLQTYETSDLSVALEPWNKATLKFIMSRGPGHLQRAIEAIIARQRRHRARIAITVEDVVFEAYGGGELTRTQMVAVRRAIRSFIRKHPRYVLIRGARLLLVPSSLRRSP
jgi:hypothetical protein